MLSGSKANPSHFHDGTVYAIKQMQQCIEQHSLRKCIFDTELYDDTFKGWVNKIEIYFESVYI